MGDDTLGLRDLARRRVEMPLRVDLEVNVEGAAVVVCTSVVEIAKTDYNVKGWKRKRRGRRSASPTNRSAGFAELDSGAF